MNREKLAAKAAVAQTRYEIARAARQNTGKRIESARETKARILRDAARDALNAYDRSADAVTEFVARHDDELINLATGIRLVRLCGEWHVVRPERDGGAPWDGAVSRLVSVAKASAAKAVTAALAEIAAARTEAETARRA